MAQREIKDILKSKAAAWTIKDRWRVLYEEAYDLVMPGLNPYGGGDDKKQPRPMNRQFDSTATKSAARLANRLLMELTPPDEDWLDVKVGPALEVQIEAQDPDNKDQFIAGINRQLAGVSTVANMVVNQGDMVDARGAAFLDLVIAGMGVMLDLEDMSDEINPIISQCVSQADVAIVTDARGRDTEFYRKRKIKLRDIEGLWGDADIPQKLKDQMKKDKGDPEIMVDEVTYWGGPKDQKWYYEVIYSDESGNDGSRLVAREYQVCPWTVFRWLRLPGVPYGPGPVLLSLADIRTANKIVEMILTNAAIALAGMYLVRDDGVTNPDVIQLKPGAMITVASTGGTMGASMAPLEAPRNFDISQLILDDFRRQIRAGLYDDSLPEVSGNPRSATEIVHRVRELTQDIGGAIGRLTSDTVQYGRKIVDILVRRGFVPFDIKIDQFTLKMQINSPLANAQKMREVEKVVQWLQMVQGLGGPQLAMIVAKLPEIAAWIADRMGVPASLVNSEEERTKVQQDMANIAASEMQADPGMTQPA